MVSRPVHWEEFRVKMVYTISFKNHCGSPHILQCVIKNPRNFLRGNYELSKWRIILSKCIAGIMFLWNDNCSANRVWKNRKKCNMHIILPKNV